MLEADLGFIKKAIKATEAIPPQAAERDRVDNIKLKLSGAHTALQNADAARKRTSIVEFIRGSLVAQIALGVIAWLLVCLLLLRFRPLALLSLHGWLERVLTIKIPKLDLFVPIGQLFLVSFFAYHRRVLDAWVAAKYTDLADKRFRKRDTVEKRLVHIQLPAELNGTKIDTGLTPGHLRELFENRTCLLIHGEGGSGKTSLACQIALWGMTPDVSQRICAHRVLPILIDHNLMKEAEGKNRLREAIAGQLANLIGENDPIPDALVEQLLRKGRLLVIIDHFSEMAQETGQ